jgi:hypothetical protein
MSLPKGLPELSLGWEILQWGSHMLVIPDGERAGEPWVYSDEQAEFILWFYAIDENGKFVYRKAVLERPKGWGKSPLLAAICCTEFMGPVDFAGFDNKGRPVGKMTPSPLIQIAAISDSQAENTYSLCREMLSNGRIAQYYPEMNVMLSKSTHPGGRILEKVTASPRGREGNRPTFVVMDETHLWIPAEQGPQLYLALNRNLTKMGRRWIQTTNAPVPGENSVAEIVYNGYKKQQEDGLETILFDSHEVYVKDIYDKEEAWPALHKVYGDSPREKGGWVPLDDIWADIIDPSTPEGVARRFYFNQRVSPPSSWLEYTDWMACQDDSIKLTNYDDIALGFRSGIDHPAALVAVRLQDGALFQLGWWECDPEELAREQYLGRDGKRHNENQWKVDWDDVDGRVRNVLKFYNVHKFIVDPISRRDVSSQWRADFGDLVEEFWLGNKGKTARTVEQFENMVAGGRIKWKSENISRHVLNCHTTEVPGGQIIRKDTQYSRRYISGAEASLLAVEAASLAIQDGGLSDGGYIFSF